VPWFSYFTVVDVHLADYLRYQVASVSARMRFLLTDFITKENRNMVK